MTKNAVTAHMDHNFFWKEAKIIDSNSNTHVILMEHPTADVIEFFEENVNLLSQHKKHKIWSNEM